MAVKVEMPKLSDTQDEGVLAKWKVEEGDEVKSGDVVAEVETDKATMEVEVFDSGTILRILVDEGAMVPLGEVMAVIGEEGEDISDIVKHPGTDGDTSNADEDEDTDEEDTEAEEPSDKEDNSSKKGADREKIKKYSTSKNNRIKASPLARDMAEKKGIALNKVEGTGPQGRIIKRDIELYEPPGDPAPDISHADSGQHVSQMRKTIARRLSESKFSSPHYYETIAINAKQLIGGRTQINEIIAGKISFNDILVKACSIALRHHPMVNSSWQDDTILQHGNVNIGVAVAVDEGLLNPVITHADQKGLEQIAAETKELAKKARNSDLNPGQTEGSTFTISNLGMFGIEEFTAIINPPNAAILAVGAIQDVPVIENGEVTPGKRMKMTISSDHRIVDGALAAQFLNTLQGLLEKPLRMLA